jgi:protein required for attachment to host cells
MRVRVIVADQNEARFYDLTGVDAQLQPAGRIVDPEAPVHGREPQLGSERSTRGHDRTAVAEASRKVGFEPRSGSEPRPRKDAAMRFARQIAAELEASRRRDGFDRTVLMAGPAFIGLVRSAMSAPVRATLVAEVRKDLIHEDDSTVHAFVPPEVFR